MPRLYCRNEIFSLDMNHLAPEVKIKGVELVDQKSADIFSLALIFYQILFRTEPFPNGIDSGKKSVANYVLL